MYKGVEIQFLNVLGKYTGVDFDSSLGNNYEIEIYCIMHSYIEYYIKKKYMSVIFAMK